LSITIEIVPLNVSTKGAANAILVFAASVKPGMAMLAERLDATTSPAPMETVG
jgi:hypothetical protein